MIFIARAEGRRIGDPEHEWEFDCQSAEVAFYAAQELFGLGVFRGPVRIYDEQNQLLLREDSNGEPEKPEDES